MHTCFRSLIVVDLLQAPKSWRRQADGFLWIDAIQIRSRPFVGLCINIPYGNKQVSHPHQILNNDGDIVDSHATSAQDATTPGFGSVTSGLSTCISAYSYHLLHLAVSVPFAPTFLLLGGEIPAG